MYNNLTMNNLKLVTELQFQQYMKDKTFAVNEMDNLTQFIIRGIVIGVIKFDNANIKNSKFYLKEGLN